MEILILVLCLLCLDLCYQYGTERLVPENIMSMTDLAQKVRWGPEYPSGFT